MNPRCDCGAELEFGDVGDVGHCERCGRYAWFATIGGRRRRLGPWFGDVDPKGRALPYDDR